MCDFRQNAVNQNICMKIRLITPAPPSSLAGNRATAIRWARIFKSLGHSVEISVDYQGEPADLMVALHAWRSAEAIDLFSTKYPDRPLIVAITGTDAYKFIHTHPQPTLHSIECADLLVGLHDLIAETVPATHRHKMRVIYQSARAMRSRQPVKRSFRVCVAGHLRDEKDSLRPALAVRDLPASSRIKVEHYGKAHTEDWAQKAEAEMEQNTRYHWHGEVPHAKLRKVYRSSHLLVLPSRMEGGANVISEAVTAGLPVIASHIDGSIGLLGRDYPGYYEVENADQLREQLLRAESDKNFYKSLQAACDKRRELFTPTNERKGWQQVLGELKSFKKTLTA